MSRSNYSEDGTEWELIRWRGAVTSAIRGKRGQALLIELGEALDAMPVKTLIANDLQRDGEHCALGVVGAKRGIDLAALDPDEHDEVADAFGVADALVREIEYINDECGWLTNETPAHRWERVRRWVTLQVKA